MTPLTIQHIGIHVRNIEEEMAFLALLGAEITSIAQSEHRGRIAFVSLDGVWHHNFALFEDGETLPSGDSQKESRGLDHIAMATDSRASVDEWVEKLAAGGVKVHGPQIQGPEGGGLLEGSGSYTIFFHDPNGVCFEIFAQPMTVREYRAKATERKKQQALSAEKESA
ncbi:MAG: VOC family protein [Proteobacteria bacterium]|nr:VOC family protein [Pseudomonadota bacterium]